MECFCILVVEGFLLCLWLKTMSNLKILGAFWTKQLQYWWIPRIKHSNTSSAVLFMQSYVLRNHKLYINYYISICAVLAAQTDCTTWESKLLGPRKTAVHLYIKVLEFSTEGRSDHILQGNTGDLRIDYERPSMFNIKQWTGFCLSKAFSGALTRLHSWFFSNSHLGICVIINVGWRHYGHIWIVMQPQPKDWAERKVGPVTCVLIAPLDDCGSLGLRLAVRRLWVDSSSPIHILMCPLFR